ncbi:hypothetical protein AB0395_45430 [Streptosporangium sp. NPDC051023]|uniref:hypothetical protein n=1 Tax=Streptosporangium sp. NPDC051023 TaxID=3155410 RepID=UPI00344BB666
MAGSFAKIYNRIWADSDFRSLTRGQQWLYFTLSSQPELNFAGVLTTTDRRLTGCAVDFTVPELRADLAALQARGYVVVDEEHDEILVRTYMRDDDAWRTPNVLTNIIRTATVVRSERVRAALAEEFALLDLDGLAGKKAEEMRDSIARVIETLTPKASARVVTTVTACIDEPFREAITEPLAEPIGQPMAEPTVVVAVVGESVKDRTSVTSPQDQPTPAESAASGDGVLIELPASKTKRPEPGSDADPLWCRFWAAYPRKVSKQEARTKWVKAVRSGVDAELIIAGAERYAAEMTRKRTAKDKIKHPDGWLHGRRWEDEDEGDSGDGYWSFNDVEEHAPAEFNS